MRQSVLNKKGYSDFVLTAAFLCLPVAVFVLTGRLSENFFVYSVTPTLLHSK